MDRAGEQQQSAARRAIDGIAEDRAAQRRTMNPHLVGASGPRRKFQPRTAGGSTAHPPLRHRMLAVRIGAIRQPAGVVILRKWLSMVPASSTGPPCTMAQ